MEIYLIRHGDCFESSSTYFCDEKQTMNPPLTPKGINQAHKLADKLKCVEFDKVYTSDLERAIHTANIMNTSLDSQIIISKAFREIDMGEIFKKPWDNFPEIYSKWALHEEDISYPNGENGADVWRRCKKEIDKIITYNYKRIAIVCHGGTIRSIICGVLNIPQQKRFYLGCPFVNCSINIIINKEKNFFLHTFNDFTYTIK